MVKNENQRLLNVRSEDERLEREEEIRLRSQVLEILSDKQFRQHIDADEYVKQIKEEAQLWINPNDLSREIERMLDEKHDYNFSIDLTGTKQTSTGQKIVDEEKNEVLLQWHHSNMNRKKSKENHRVLQNMKNKRLTLEK